MYGMASLSSTFALLLVTERSLKSKHVQQVSGVYLSNYWFSALLWDLINFMLPCLLMLVQDNIQDTALLPFLNASRNFHTKLQFMISLHCYCSIRRHMCYVQHAGKSTKSTIFTKHEYVSLGPTAKMLLTTFSALGWLTLDIFY